MPRIHSKPLFGPLTHRRLEEGAKPPGARPIVTALGLLILVALTLAVSDTALRFERVAPGLLTLADGDPAELPGGGALLRKPLAEGLALQAQGRQRAGLRWERPAPQHLDKLRLAGSVTVNGGSPEARPWQRAQLHVVQPDLEHPTRRLVARWPAEATKERFDRLLTIPDPTRPLWIELTLTPLSGQVLLHRLEVDGLTTRPGIDALRWTLLAVWVAAALGTLGALARPMTPPLRFGVWTVLTVMLVGLLSPPELLQGIKDIVAILLPQGPPRGATPDAHVLGHFALFGALAILLFWGRTDLGWLRLAGLLAVLAGATELMQLLVDGRQADWHDVAVDLAGVGLAALLVALGRQVDWPRAGTHPMSTASDKGSPPP